MSALTIRLPDDKHQRLKELARRRKTSVNRLIDEMTTLMLAEFDAETRFALRAARGADRSERGLELLRKAAE
jgi:predicted transcriptional regulator